MIYEFSLIDSEVNNPQTSAVSTINFYAEKIGKKNYVLRRTPGLNLFSKVGSNGGGRGVHTMVSSQEYLFAVRGSSFQQYDPIAKVFNEVGVLGNSTGPVNMENNGTQIIIVAGGKSWGYNPSTPGSFALITQFPGTNQYGAAFSSLRILSVDLGTGFFWCSNQDDVTTWSGTAGADTESFPDPAVGIAAIGQVVFVFCTTSYEVWTDQGYQDFPFRRAQAGIKIGCIAPASIVVFGGQVYWLGGSAEGKGIVYTTQGYQATPISDVRIDEIISGLPNIEDAVGFIYQEQGHVFYVLSFQAGDLTLTYDITFGLWSQREYRNPSTGVTSRRPETSQCVYQGMNLVQDFRDGTVYEMSRDYYTDNGDPVVHTKVFDVWPEEQEALVSVPSFGCFMDMGGTPEGKDPPKAMLQLSDDRGITYGYEIYRNLPSTGQYGYRVAWHGMGSSYGRNFKLKLTGMQDFTIRRCGLLEG